MTKGSTSRRITIRGIVQGVGFRPFVYNLAHKLEIAGTVKNTSSGVIIEAASSPDRLDDFYQQLQNHAPVLSRIDEIQWEEISNDQFIGFEILESEIQPGSFSIVPPDMAICQECKHELFDQNNRRYRYPFINCTNCGPRFSIIRKMPYDRPFTSMDNFPLCPDCKEEYEDPTNRRFHAQPIACPICGPQLTYYQDGYAILYQEEALQKARSLIASGGILAMKGIGGYQLVCDAHNLEAIDRLRKGKLRSAKPFALMAYDSSIIARYCRFTPEDVSLLQSPQSPIVILPSINSHLQHNAPGQTTLGFMLPYTPLHYLITEPSTKFPDVLVMTSGNISEEPMLIEDQDAMRKLSNIADGFLGHDRPILNRVDDSVYKSKTAFSTPIRRARGYSPDPILLNESLPEVFASGALLKNTFTLIKNKQAFVSHYIGDLDNLETYRDYESSINKYFDLFQFSPEIIACDEHPDFLSTQYASSLSESFHLPLLKIQHHHAHLAACLAENRQPLNKNVIAICYDGTGYGEDGAIWGGEILFGNALDYRRMAHLQYLPLPGGDQAIKKPYRIALAYLHFLELNMADALAPYDHCPPLERQIIQDQVDKNINIVQTSSMGRLFDAVSSLIGIRQEVSYEGQAAIELESIADPQETGIYPYSIDERIIGVSPIISSILADLYNHVSPSIISARFHNTIVQLSIDSIVNIMNDVDCHTVALSGGVWQNSLLLALTVRSLKEKGLEVLTHQLLPPNDGCISLGQAVIAGKNFKRN